MSDSDNTSRAPTTEPGAAAHPPRVPQPATVAARARAERRPGQTPAAARVPFFANAAQPEIGQLHSHGRANPDVLLTARADSASEPEGPLLPLPADRADRRRCPIMARYVLARPLKSKQWLTPLSPAGSRWLQGWSKELQQGSRLAYFGLTTLLGTHVDLCRSKSHCLTRRYSAGTQTLGEEYCDIMQYESKSRKPPSRAVSPEAQTIIVRRSLT